MEYFYSGSPDLWAFIDGAPYIIGECGWEEEAETTSVKGVPSIQIQGQTVSGFAKLFGKEPIELRDKMGVPREPQFHIIAEDTAFSFKDVIFTLLDELPQYDNVAVKVEWASRDLTTKPPEELNRGNPYIA